MRDLAVKRRAAYRCQWETGYRVTTSVLELWVGLGSLEGHAETEIMQKPYIWISLLGKGSGESKKHDRQNQREE